MKSKQHTISQRLSAHNKANDIHACRVQKHKKKLFCVYKKKKKKQAFSRNLD